MWEAGTKHGDGYSRPSKQQGIKWYMACTGQHRNFATLTTAGPRLRVGIPMLARLHAPCTLALHALAACRIGQRPSAVRRPPALSADRRARHIHKESAEARPIEAFFACSPCRGQPGKRPARVERRSFCSLLPHTQLHHPPAARISRMGPRLPPSVVCQPILPPMRSGCYSASMKREKKMML